MMMRKILLSAVICCLPLVLIGCGSNLFPKATASADLNSRMDQAKTVADYQNIRQDAAAAVAANPGDVNANLNLGKAILGENGIAPLDLTSQLSKLTESDSTNSQSAYTVLGEVLTKVPSSDLRVAADALNRAASDNEQVPSRDQLTRGVANTLAATDLVNNAFVVGDNGVTPTGDLDAIECLNAIMDPNGDGKTVDGFNNYTKNANEALMASGILKAGQSADIKEITEAGDNVELIYLAVKGGAPYTGGGVTITSSSSAADVNTALNAIFKNK